EYYNDAVIYGQVHHVRGHNWAFDNRRLTYVLPSKDNHDAVIKEETITSINKDTFDGKNKKISNILPGTSPSDVAILNQIIQYDEQNNQFKYKDKVFHIVEYNPNILVADPTLISGLRRLDGTPYLPKNYVYRRESDHILIGANKQPFHVERSDDKLSTNKKDE